MIIYNWDLALTLLIMWFFANAIGLLLLGLMRAEKNTQYGTSDILSALIFMAILIVPAIV